MGNNKKTVKCSFCNRLGHNRVTCEKLSNLIEETRKKFGSDHPDVSEHDHYKKNIVISLERTLAEQGIVLTVILVIIIYAPAWRGRKI